MPSCFHVERLESDIVVMSIQDLKIEFYVLTKDNLRLPDGAIYSGESDAECFSEDVCFNMAHFFTEQTVLDRSLSFGTCFAMFYQMALRWPHRCFTRQNCER